MMSHPQRVRVDCTEIYGIIAGTPGCRQSAQVLEKSEARERVRGSAGHVPVSDGAANSSPPPPAAAPPAMVPCRAAIR
jgi:hypothetical protein